MFGPRLETVLCALISSIAAAALLSAQPALSLTASHEARALQPGEIVRLRVSASAPVARLTGSAFGKTIYFVDGPAPNAFEGLIAIDVETKPGRYDVTLKATPAGGGSAAELTYPLPVEQKAFDTRRLTVDPNFVNPPADELARIQKETTLQANAFATVTPKRLWSGPFIQPVTGPSTGRYGQLSLFNGEPRSRHRGTDFRASTGTPVRAPAAGRIVLSADLYFSGGSVIIDHGQTLFSQLAHLSRRDVVVGEIVEAGQVIGLSGATGRVTGPHLHWSARLGSASIDPVSLLKVLGTGAAAAAR